MSAFAATVVVMSIDVFGAVVGSCKYQAAVRTRKRLLAVVVALMSRQFVRSCKATRAALNLT